MPPIISATSDLEALGIRLVEKAIVEDLGHIFRETTKRDIGIDGEIEIVENGYEKLERRGTGRLIALQIKCGMSFFKKTRDDAFIFEGDMKHLDYWIGHSLPVLVLLCHPVDRVVYWVEVTSGAVMRSSNTWKILVPKSNKLTENGWIIKEIGGRNHTENLIDLCVQAWIHAKNGERVEFCGIFQLPRDYHWYRHLVQIGDSQVMVHWLYARYGEFEIKELRDVLRHLPSNLIYGDKLLLCLVADSRKSFEFSEEWNEICQKESDVEIFHLIFDRDWPSVGELTFDGKIISEYYKGEPIFG